MVDIYHCENTLMNVTIHGGNIYGKSSDHHYILPDICTMYTDVHCSFLQQYIHTYIYILLIYYSQGFM